MNYLPILLIIIYFLWPIDLVPDFIPLIGYIDDLVIAFIGWRYIK